MSTASTTALSSNYAAAPFGATVTLTASVSGSGGTPTGTVTFTDGTSTLGTASLSGGVATFPTSTLAVGIHAAVVATYGGDGTFAGSASASFKQVITRSTFWTLDALDRMAAGTLNPATASLKVMLVGATYATYRPTALHTLVDPGVSDSTSPKYCELDATNYARGFGAAGRKAVTITKTKDTGDVRIEFVAASDKWIALGGATNDTAKGALIIEEGTSDADSKIIAFISFGSPISTDGHDLSLNWDTVNGQLQMVP